MSMFLAARVWHCNVDHTTAHFLMALCDIAEDDGTRCHPSPEYVMWKTGLRKTTYYDLLGTLQAAGAVEYIGQRGTYAEYHIHLDALPQKPAWLRPEKRPRGRPAKKIPPDGNIKKDSATRNELPEKIPPRGRINGKDSAWRTPRSDISIHPNRINHPRESDPSYFDPRSLNDFQRWCESGEGRAELTRRGVDRSHAFGVYRHWCASHASHASQTPPTCAAPPHDAAQ